MAAATPKRRWFQFSLRTLLVMMLACGLALGWFARELQVARNRERAIAELEQAGIYIYEYEPTALGRAFRRVPSVDLWVRINVGDSLLSTPSGVRIYRFDDNIDFVLSRLKLFPSLTNVDLWIWDFEPFWQRLRAAFPNVKVEHSFY